jgi:hypothetical protein
MEVKESLDTNGMPFLVESGIGEEDCIDILVFSTIHERKAPMADYQTDARAALLDLLANLGRQGEECLEVDDIGPERGQLGEEGFDFVETLHRRHRLASLG